jgi:hypothetical protein
MATDALPFTFTNAADGTPALTAGTDTTMTLAVTNRTGADIDLVAHVSALSLALPRAFFTSDEIGAMTPGAPPGWAGVVTASTWTVTFTYTQGGTWRQGDPLTFTIGQLRSAAQPGIRKVNLLPKLPDTPGISASYPADLALKANPAPGQQALPLPLAASLSGGGVIYCSSPSDPLVNSLELTVWNSSTTGLSRAPGQAAGTPSIVISFVYGTTAGALAPDLAPKGSPAPADSAWNIQATPAVSNALWSVTAAKPTGDNSPAWTLAPAGDTSLFGAAGTDDANFSVAFSEIRSFNQPGHTQVTVLCTGFMKDAQTPYADLVLVLDLDKAEPPASRGVVAFGAPDVAGIVSVTTPGTILPLGLRWTLYGGVKRVLLITSSPSVLPVDLRYPNAPMLESRGYTLPVPAPASGGPVVATLQAFDGSGNGNGTFLNEMQFTVAVQVMYATDPLGVTYSAERYGTTLWMTEDYDYATPDGTDSTENDGSSGGPTGRYYTWEAAHEYAPDGWVLPNDDDWNALVAGQPWSALVYNGPGSAGFNAVISGLYRPNDSMPHQNTDIGYYWTATGQIPMQFLGGSGSPIQPLDSPVSPDTQIAVRYVRRL